MGEKILFVCTGNIDRSPTAEEMFKGKPGFSVKSAGTSPEAPNKISAELINWADKIFAMEEEHKREIIRIVPEAVQKTIVLGIPDVFKRNQPELKRLIQERLKGYSKLT
ncbi:phosphotyrosine protein phosphatase [Candidatus Bathyarchaeota archaeon]|nr:phosphotyrosine protein phosphatase [Candidatus Bathyarchaeota archaeon]